MTNTAPFAKPRRRPGLTADFLELPVAGKRPVKVVGRRPRPLPRPARAACMRP